MEFMSSVRLVKRQPLRVLWIAKSAPSLCILVPKSSLFSLREGSEMNLLLLIDLEIGLII